MNKLVEIEIARGFSIIGVLMIHGTSQAVVNIPAGSRSQFFYLALNRWGHFSVPTFIFLSGFVLFYRYFSNWDWKHAQSFYRKRFTFILIPYGIWSAFYYGFYHWINNNNGSPLSFSAFLSHLLYGTAGYHLYFIVLITQFYILFPLLLLLVKRLDKAGFFLILIGLTIQIAAGILGSQYEGAYDKSLLSTTYFAAFCIGGSIAINYPLVYDKIVKNLNIIFSLAILFYVAHVVISLHGEKYSQTIKELVVNSYSILTAISLIGIGKLIVNRFVRSAALLSIFGAASFGIYFLHPALLSIWNTYLNLSPYSKLYHFANLTGIMLILVVPVILVSLFRKAKVFWTIIGK